MDNKYILGYRKFLGYKTETNLFGRNRYMKRMYFGIKKNL
jgi:hypothetical protein